MSDPNDLKLPASEPITENQGEPTIKFQRKWQAMLDKLKELETRIEALEP